MAKIKLAIMEPHLIRKANSIPIVAPEPGAPCLMEWLDYVSGKPTSFMPIRQVDESRAAVRVAINDGRISAFVME